MSNIAARLTKLESVQATPKRQYSDAERAVRYTYLLEKGGPDADKLRALLEKAGDDHDKP